MIAPSEARRIEAGIFNYGSDIRIEDTPLHERAREVRRVGPGADFLGRRRLEEIRDGDLLDRKLVGIEIGGEPMTDEGALNDFWPLVEGDARVGRSRPAHGRPGSRGTSATRVPIRWEAPGSAFEAESREAGCRSRLRACRSSTPPRTSRSRSLRRRERVHPVRQRGRPLRPDAGDLRRDDGPHDRAAGLRARDAWPRPGGRRRYGAARLTASRGRLLARGSRPLRADARQARREGRRRTGLPLVLGDATDAVRRWDLRRRVPSVGAPSDPRLEVGARRDGSGGPPRRRAARLPGCVRRGELGDPRSVHGDHGPLDGSGRPVVGRPRRTRRRARTIGAKLRVLPAIPEEEEETLGAFLDEVEEGRWSWTWHVPEDVRRDAVREIRPWAEERFGPLDRIERYEVETVWRAYDLPGRES